MIYKNFQGEKLSALGLGCMRLPVLEGNDARIDEAAAKEMVDFAMAQGINYYDTAWGYHEGNSELVIGRALASYPRETFFLATKFHIKTSAAATTFAIIYRIPTLNNIHIIPSVKSSPITPITP